MAFLKISRLKLKVVLKFHSRSIGNHDSQKKQENFSKKHDFPFPLLADENKDVINAFGVWGLKKFMGKEYEGIHRKTFIIDGEGKVERLIDKVKTKAHAAQILE